MATKNIYPVNKPTPCYNKAGEQIGWYNPRFLCTVGFIFVYSKVLKEWCVLASIRGGGAESFKGHMNCPCGYMDINVTMAENAAKEIKEETGVDISPSDLVLVSVEDEPSAYQQHVTAIFSAIIRNKDVSDFQFSHDGNEVDENGNLEVGDILFIPLSKVSDYNWAFGHDEKIINISKKSHLYFMTTLKIYRQKIKNFLFNFLKS